MLSRGGLYALQKAKEKKPRFLSTPISERFIADVQLSNTTASLLCGNTRTFCAFLTQFTQQPARLGGNDIDT